MKLHHGQTASVVFLAIAAMGAADATQPATAPATQSVSAAQDFPTGDELAAAFRAGKYADVLRDTGRIRRTPAVLAQYDDLQLLLLRAESFLQLRNGAMAIQTFEQAAKGAEDSDRRALMRATKLLVQRSIGLKYPSRFSDENGDPWPRTGERHAPVQFDLLDLSKRSAALRALYTDQWFAASAAVDQAKRAADMSAFDTAMLNLGYLGTVERAVMGKEEATDKLRRETATAINTTLRGSISRISKRADVIQEQASEMVSVPLPSSNSNRPASITRARGLDSTTEAELDRMRRQLEEVEPRTTALASDLHVEPNVFAQSVQDAAAAKKLVTDVLQNNIIYHGSWNSP